ncbi:MAG: hypothetical protein N3G22_02670 [Candidatus Micrarchaeota archaeon]|nr:hypothetical protein [Candidatus Micrarchaeota archaeon]
MADLSFITKKFEKMELFASLLLFLAAFGFWHFPAKHTLHDFSVAIGLQNAVLGAHSSPFMGLMAQAEKLYSSLLSLPPESSTTISSFLLFLPSLLLASISVVVYLALRQISIRRSAAAFSVLLFTLSLQAMFSFLPGVVSEEQLAAALFTFSSLFLALYVARQKRLVILPAYPLFALAGFFSSSFALAGVAMSLSFAIPAYLKEDRRLPYMIIAAIIFSASSFLLPQDKPLSIALGNFAQLLTNSPFLVAVASVSVLLFFLAAASLQSVLLFFSALAISATSPLAGAVLLVFPAAEASHQLFYERLSKKVKLLSVFLIAFISVFGLSFLQSEDAIKSLAAAVLLAPVLPFFLYFYDFKEGQVFAALGMLLISMSVSCAVFYQLYSPNRPLFYDADLTDALIHLSNSSITLNVAGSTAPAQFYLPNSQIKNHSSLSDFLLSGESPPAKGEYILLSLSDLDNADLSEKGGYEAYRFASNFTYNERTYAVFFSSFGGNLVREVDASGRLSLSDGQLIDSSGMPYANIPISRMFLLQKDQPFHSPTNRLIVMTGERGPPFFLKLYAGEAEGIAKVYGKGKVAVFKVE